MENVILVIHLLLALSIIGLVLIQRSEGGGLGIGGGGGGMGSFAGVSQTANALTRATAICAGLFFLTSLILAVMAGTHHKSGSLLDSLDNPPAPVTGEVQPDGTKPSSTPTDKHSVDSSAPTSDKEVPRAADEPQPQTGAPSAPISE
ncbi:MAG: preprotein translocase subunit SecG [Micavibrio aeruginosavorus]|uniref:Protein-export membrane protein SecG n=1 Tax=Micavibrio aeruginosavorus TaxID=349221 RepID=A0A2W5A2Q4_9BACT|nr:MAG: preprotein translocase subunit SecG [Micavibrio aeruginosavorus]